MLLFARLAAVVPVMLLTACAAPLPLCNSDVDCGARVCRLGQCVDDPDRPVPLPEDGRLRVPDENDDGDGDGDDALPACGTRIEAWRDGDGDGFSASPTLVCDDEPLPAGTTLTPRYAPVHLVEPEVVDVRTGQWDLDEGAFIRSNAAPIGALAISGFACAGELEAAAGIEILVALDGPGAPATDVTVQLEVQGALSEPRTASIAADDAQLRLGGADDTFGLTLTPAQVCDAGFTVHLTVAPESGNSAPLAVRAAAVRAYGADDCDDEDAGAFSPASLRTDADLDGYAGGLRLPACIGLVVPAGRGVRDADCAPDDASAYPGQPQRFARERLGVGGFDFDCDDDEEPLDEALMDMSSCTLSADGTTCNVYYASLTPQCGETVGYGDCYGTCQLVQRQFTQLCR